MNFLEEKKQMRFYKYKSLLFIIIALIISTNVTANASTDLTKTESLKRKVVVINGRKDINNILQNIKHEKVKDLVNLPNSNVCIMKDSDAIALENSNPDVKVYSDCTFKVPQIKSSKKQTKQLIPWGIKEIKADAAWKMSTGKHVKVAVLDSGIDYKHPDLRKNIKEGFNAIDHTKVPIDDYGHGTHVSGILGAVNNNKGIVGVSPDVNIYPVKVLDETGTGTISDVADGIEWCIKNKIQIINMSFGISEDMPLLHDSIIKAQNAGIIIVAASGNQGGEQVDYPAAYNEVISVSAIDEKDSIADFCPKGKVDFCAPGVDVYSTYPNSSYEYLSGTSMSTPFITGTIALILENHPKYTTKDVINKLTSTSNDLGAPGKDNIYGAGLVNAYRATYTNKKN